MRSLCDISDELLMSPYVAVVILAVLAAVVVGAMVSLNTLLGPRASNSVKRLPFECGNPPSGRRVGPLLASSST